MKKIKKLLKKLNNRGSSLIMVIVSVAFVAILVGALLSAAMYGYRLKLLNKNSKDNFYYVEQAMQEIYAGVGSKTVEQMYNAYTDTVENMVYYDVTSSTYKTLSNDDANQMFKKRFIANVKNEEYFRQSDDKIAESFQNFITNDTVKLDGTALHVIKNDDSIVIKDVVLTRTADYNNNTSSGTYTQTISADITISEPDFEVNFDTTSADYSNIFNFSMVGDMGIEVEQNAGTTLKITGNVYAASDYYNKAYNDTDSTETHVNEAGSSETSTDKTFKYSFESEDSDGNTISNVIEYNNGSVSSKKYAAAGDDSGLYNKYAKADNGDNLYFDGENTNSLNSGLYINNSNVSILADLLIVPGSISVMNGSDLSVYNKTNGKVTAAEVWADNIVLGGYGENVKEGSTQTSVTAPSAYFAANLFVRDDTELNAQNSSLEIKGNYYGYGDSTERDTRTFVPTVDKENFMLPATDEDGKIMKDSDGNIIYSTNRGHYNSSSIVINGQKSTLNLSDVNILYLAGRSYIELSKDVDYKDTTLTSDGKLSDAEDATGTSVKTETYTYNPVNTDSKGNVTNFITDYKTGESLSVKSNQLAYIPIISSGLPADKVYSDKTTCTAIELSTSVKGNSFFEYFFPTKVFGGYVPVISQTIDSKTYYYYDLSTAYNLIKSIAPTSSVLANYKTADEYATGFIKCYSDAAAGNCYYGVDGSKQAKSATNTEDIEELQEILKDKNIVSNEDFTSGNVILSGDDNDGSDSTIYSSGAITTKNDTTFNMVVDDDASTVSTIMDKLLSYSGNETTAENTENLVAQAFKYSKSLSMEYAYVKWNLGHFDESETSEQNYIDQMFANDWTEDMLTPINRFMDFSKITKDSDSISPSNFELSSGYKVWVDYDDVEIGANEKDFCLDNNGAKTTTVKGIVITKGDVTFNSKVTRFEGLIIAGGKIYIKGNLESMTASPEICRSIIRELMVSGSATGNEFQQKCLYVRNLFNQYKLSDDGRCPVCGALLETDPESGEDVCPTEDCTYNSASNANELLVDFDTLDYSDVCSLDNWNKRVE